MNRPNASLRRLLPVIIWLTLVGGVHASGLSYFKRDILVTADMHLDRVQLNDGQVELAAGGRADVIEVNSGGVHTGAQSEAQSITMHNGSLRIAGLVSEHIHCGNGELRILSGARIRGLIENYNCRIRIDEGAVVDATIRNHAGQVELDRSAVLAGDLHFLRAADTADEVPSRILLELDRDAQIEGALVTHYCIGIKLARGASIAQQRGIAPRHIGLRRRASDPYRSCQTLSAPLTGADVGSGAERRIQLGSGVSLGSDSTLPVFVVNGGIRVNTGRSAGALQTINGSVEMETDAHAKSVQIVNGALMMEHRARLDGDVSINNGAIFMDADAEIRGAAQTDVGSVFVSYRAKVGRALGNRIGNIVLLPGAEIGSLHFRHFADRELKSGRSADTLHIHKNARIHGEIVFDRPITVYIAAGVEMPKYRGIAPRVREADERMYQRDSLGYAKDGKCADQERAQCRRDEAQ